MKKTLFGLVLLLALSTAAFADSHLGLDPGDNNWLFSRGGNTILANSTTNVGIGTTLGVPSKLYVVGNIVATGTVTGTGGTTSGPLVANNTISFSSEVGNGTTGIGTKNIDWTLGNKQNVGLGTFTGTTLTFTAPTTGVSALQLRLSQDATGSRTITTWPTIKWAGGSAPTLTTTASKDDIVSCFYNGTSYFCSPTQNF